MDNTNKPTTTMIDEATYERMKRFSDEGGSWAIWSPPRDGKGPKDGTGDLSVFNGDVWKSLNRDYVFIGLNLACHDSLVGDDEWWWNFHSKDDKRQNDFKLRHALLGTKFWGAYMTDAIKGVYQTDSAKVSVGKSEGVIQMAKLEDELNALGGHPVLIAMGVKAYKVVSRHFAPKYTVKSIMHYANYISKENYREKVLEALTDC